MESKFESSQGRHSFYAMHVIKRLIFYLALIAIIGFAGLSIYVKSLGAMVIQEALSESLNQKVYIAKAAYRFPFIFRLNNMTVGHHLEAKDVFIYFSPNAFLQLVVDQFSNKPIRVKISRANIQGGRWQYVYKTANKDLFLQMKNISFKAENVVLPMDSSKIAFQFSGNLDASFGHFGESRVQGKGWINMIKKDLNADIHVVLPDGEVGLTAHAVSKDNDMNVNGEIKLSDFLKNFMQNKLNDVNLADQFMLEALALSEIDVATQYSFQTKMDDFRLGSIQFQGDISTRELSETVQ